MTTDPAVAAAADPGVLCSTHQAPLYPDMHDGRPMARYLCPEPGCASVVTADWLASVRDQIWCEGNGMTAPGWQTLTVSPPGIGTQ